MSYEVVVTEVGALVEELAGETNSLIIYNEDIKDKDLREISRSEERRVGKEC